MSGELRLMTQAGKTFYFATLWLDKRSRLDAALAYNFCRTVDDIADQEPPRPDRDLYLQGVAEAVARGDTSDPLVQPLAPLLERFPEIREPLADLARACCEDTPQLEIRDEDALVRYAHGVAGNVGLIMYPILGGASPIGKQFAADLGIAMQCTNIARDVFEDLERGRVYLPTTWLQGREPRKLLDENSSGEPIVVDAVQRVLRVAQDRYERGISGINYLAPHSRFAIRIAARCYSAIGERVIRDGRLSRERAVVPLSSKIVMACKMGLSSVRERRLPQESN